MASNYDVVAGLKDDEAIFLVRKVPVLQAEIQSKCPSIDIERVNLYAFECACTESEQLGKSLKGKLFIRRCYSWRYHIYHDILNQSGAIERIAEKVNDFMNLDQKANQAFLEKRVKEIVFSNAQNK